MIEPCSLLEASKALSFVVVAIYQLIKDYEGCPETVRRLKTDLAALVQCLQSLRSIGTKDNEKRFEGLLLPLNECRRLCQNFEELLSHAVKTKDPERKSLQDWFRLKIRSADIDDFGRAVASIKATLLIAIGSANLEISTVTIDVVQGFTEHLSSTICDLQASVQRVTEKSVDHRDHSATTVSDQESIEWQISSQLKLIEDCLIYAKDVRNTINDTYAKLEVSSDIANRTAPRLPVNILGQNAADEILHKVLCRTAAIFDNASIDFHSLRQRLQSAISFGFGTSQSQTIGQGNHRPLNYTENALQQLVDFCRQRQDAGEKATAKGNVVKNTDAAQNGQLVVVSSTEQLFDLDNVHAAKEAIVVIGQLSDAAVVNVVDAHHKSLSNRQTQANGDGAK